MGIEKELIRAGTGPKPSPGQNVTVHCTGFASGEKNIENVMKCFFDQEIVGDKELANYLRGKVSVVEDHIAKTNRLFYKMDGKRTCDTFKDRFFISVMPTLPIHLIEQPICLSNTLFNHGKNGDLTQKFWSTKDPGQQPFTFKIGQGQVIKGWDEGVLGMQLGEVARLRCSPDYAYGAGGFPAWGIQPNSTLIFEIEVLRAQ